MDLETLISLIPPTIEKEKMTRGLVIRYSVGAKKWFCHHQTSSNKMKRKIQTGVIAVGETPKEAVENYISKNTKAYV